MHVGYEPTERGIINVRSDLERASVRPRCRSAVPAKAQSILGYDALHGKWLPRLGFRPDVRRPRCGCDSDANELDLLRTHAYRSWTRSVRRVVHAGHPPAHARLVLCRNPRMVIMACGDFPFYNKKYSLT